MTGAGARLACALLAAMALAWSAPAQAAGTADAARLAGSDRARLIAGAKAEGAVSVYSSATIEDMALVVDAFEARYGVRVAVWRGGSAEILQRTITEARAGRHAVDVIEIPGSELEAINRERLLQEVSLPVFAELMPQAVMPGRPWVATRLIVFALAYNTNLVRPADVPKSYRDLLDPKWRGKIGIEATDFNWFMSLTDAMGGEAGVQLFRDIGMSNGYSVRVGHTLLGNLVISGEVPLALNLYRHFLEPAKRDGAPIDYVYLPPAMAVPSAAAVTRNAPHPYAAVLFLEFLLSDGQRILSEHDTVPTNLRYQELPEGLDLTFLDVSKYVDESAKWRAAFREVFTGR